MATPAYQQILKQAEKLTLAELQQVMEQLQQKIEAIQRAEDGKNDRSESGTLAILAQWAKENPVSFDDPTLSERVD